MDTLRDMHRAVTRAAEAADRAERDPSDITREAARAAWETYQAAADAHSDAAPSITGARHRRVAA